jgi:uncharacterized cupredoxin-like copper-binding protein
MNTSDRRSFHCRTLGGLGVGLAALALLATSACAAPIHSPADGGGMSMGTEATTQVHAADRTIAISTTDQLRFEPNDVKVNAGETVEFIVSNAGGLPHEFVIGTQSAQDAHEQMMGGNGHGQMVHAGDSDSVEVPANGSATLVHTFDQPGTLLFGCHVAGHYPAGMQGTITVTPAGV